MTDLKDLAEKLVNLSVKEVNDLAEILKKDYGIEPAAGPIVAAQTAPQPEEQAPDQEKNQFDLIIKSPGGAKLKVVKLVKDITGLGLKEAKAVVDAAPKAIKEGITKEEAEALKEQLEEVGAEVEIK